MSVFGEFFMKYLVPLVFALPLLTSCEVVQGEYYEQGYYSPSPRVEVVPNYGPRHYHDHARYRSAPRGRVYHGHANTGAGAVVVTPRGPQSGGQYNVHGHDANAGAVVRHPQSAETQVQRNVHGHDGMQQNTHGHSDTNEVRHPQTSGTQVQKSVHGHS